MFPDKPLNTYFHGILGLAMVYFCGWFFYDLPANNGLLETIEWNFPDGHTVTTVSPIDYTLRKEPDGSAVVVVGDTERD